MSGTTIHSMLRESVRRHGTRPALGWRDGGGLSWLTYGDLWRRVNELRRGLAALGCRRGDRIALLSYNRPEWALCDLAAQSLGIVTVPMYHTLPTAQVEYLVRDSAARALIVEDEKQLAKALDVWPRVRTLDHVITMRGATSGGAITLDQVVELGAGLPVSDEELDQKADSISPEDLATLIYTSGTTGEPKGAMLTHRALLHTSLAAREIVRLDENDVFLSFLPLCHVIERVGGHYLPLSLGARIVYSEGPFALAAEMAEVKPTLFLCVPRVYESMQEKVLERVAKLPPARRTVFEWALGIGLACARRRSAGKMIGPILVLKRCVAERLALRLVRQQVTGGRIRYYVSGGAPLSPGTAEFFAALGICILEGYGLTEFPVISLNRPGRTRARTVGEALAGIEAHIAPDGEILARGPSLMRGYFGKPEDTREVIDDDGWFHTGDIGELSTDDYLRITDRKKDIIVLANGKNVAPQPIEARIRQSPFIAEVVLLGDRSNSIMAVVVPAFDRLRSWARDNELPVADTAGLVRRAEVRKLIKDEIERASNDLADFERVKRFVLADAPFSIEGGELTPTLKVKRRVVAARYADAAQQAAR